MPSNKEIKAAVEDAAEQIAAMLHALKAKGLSEQQAVVIVAGMLASTNVYLPFAQMTEGSMGTRH